MPTITGGIHVSDWRTKWLRRDVAPSPLPEDYDARSMAVTGSMEEPVTYSYEAQGGGFGKRLHVARMIFVMGGSEFRDDAFAHQFPLQNGLLIEAVDVDGTTVVNDFLDGMSIRSNVDFSTISDIEYPQEKARTIGWRSYRVVRWALSDSGGTLRVPMFADGQRIRVTVRDNLTSIITMRAVLHGWVE
jgi:hypothetical protein